MGGGASVGNVMGAFRTVLFLFSASVNQLKNVILPVELPEYQYRYQYNMYSISRDMSYPGFLTLA